MTLDELHAKRAQEWAGAGRRARERNAAQMAGIKARLQAMSDEGERDPVHRPGAMNEAPVRANGFNVNLVRRFIAETPGSPGNRYALGLGLDMILAGRPHAIGGLMDHMNPTDVVQLLPVLIEANASPEFLREAIWAVVRRSHKSLPLLVQAAGGRPGFADWCRRARFMLPDYVREDPVTIARGTVNCTPEQNAAGMHWSLGSPASDAFDGAAFFASGWPRPTVVIARVPRSALVYFMDGMLPYEVMPDDVPSEYEVITDTKRIIEGAVRFAYHRRDGGFKAAFDPVKSEFDRSAAELIAWSEARTTSGVVAAIVC